jgi:aryl-alcohol dehydrogenase
LTTCTAAVARVAGAPFSLETVEVEAPRRGEVRVRIAGVGLCHTDLVFRDQVAGYPMPAVLGHEGAGTIEALGEGVEGLSIGDPVVLGFSSCGACARCGEGLPSYCAQFTGLNYAGQRLEDGTSAYGAAGERLSSHFFGQSSFSSYAVTRASNVVRITGAAPPLALLGPLGCGFQTGAGAVMRSMACPAGSSLAIFGGGPVGLAAVMAAGIQGCAATILVEPIASRRAMAQALGATHVIDPNAGDLGDALRAAAPGGVDFVLETSGSLTAIEAALGCLASRGMVGLVGVPRSMDARASFTIAQLITYGHRIIGIIEGDSAPWTFIPELLALNAAGRFPFEQLIKTFPLAEINDAVRAQAQGECIKVVLIP